MKIDGKKLKEAIKALNGIVPETMEKPINPVGKTNATLLEIFAKALVGINEVDKLDEVPELAFDYYQEMFPPKDEPKTKADELEAKPAPKKKKTAEQKVPDDEWYKKYGVRPTAKSFEFLSHLRGNPSTMPEIQKALWNVKGVTYYNLFNKLAGNGLAVKDVDGAMRLV